MIYSVCRLCLKTQGDINSMYSFFLKMKSGESETKKQENVIRTQIISYHRGKKEEQEDEEKGGKGKNKPTCRQNSFLEVTRNCCQFGWLKCLIGTDLHKAMVTMSLPFLSGPQTKTVQITYLRISPFHPRQDIAPEFCLWLADSQVYTQSSLLLFEGSPYSCVLSILLTGQFPNIPFVLPTPFQYFLFRKKKKKQPTTNNIFELRGKKKIQFIA